LRKRFGLALTRPATFAVERRLGWVEAATTQPRGPNDAWDERRANRVTMEKPRPTDPADRLLVNGRHPAFREMGPAWGRPTYWLERGAELQPLDDVQWADWDRSGRLLVATTPGELQVRMAPFDPSAVSWRFDLSALGPDPAPPPGEALRW